MLMRSVLLLILCGIDFAFLLGGYSVLRILHISVNWVTWIIGSFIIELSLAVCVAILIPALVPTGIGRAGNLVGALSFFIAVYAASQWMIRHWYLNIKRRAGKWLVQASKNLLMFLRKHHQFFGWIVLAGAVGHMVFFFPILSRMSGYEEMTGFLAIGILALLVILGIWLWIESSWRKRRTPKVVHTLHSTLTIAFFVALLLHI
jgi:mannose/fructose/N-acetylgalactosamine-specific phosphotransferase system component IID